MADRDPDTKTKERPPGSGDKDALRRHTDQDQLKPQGSNPADKRPTDPDAIERSDLPERDKQYGSDDN